MQEARLVTDAKAQLGEGPFWDCQRKALYWVDILDGDVHVLTPEDKSERVMKINRKVSSIVSRKKGGMIVTLEDGFYLFDEFTGVTEEFAIPAGISDGVRFNDGKCDPCGRYWAGTMSTNSKQGTASLYCLDCSGRVKEILSNVTISNGMAWNIDTREMFYTDTPQREIWAFGFDKETGDITDKRIAVDVDGEDGVPDGMTIDAEGMLWIALWGGWKVVRYNPKTGKKLDEILIPTANVTSCTFGGSDMQTLYITTASSGLDKQALEKQLLAGGLFEVRLNVKGTGSWQYMEDFIL